MRGRRLLLRTGRFLPLRRRFSRRVAVGVPALAILVAIEWLGRGSATDAGDALALGALAVTAAAWLGLDVTARRGIVGRAWRLRDALRSRVPELGADLRGQPPWPRGWPPAVRAVVLAGLAVAAAVVGWTALSPVPFRVVAVQGLYVGYVALVGLLWALLIAAALSLPWFAVELIVELMRDRGRGGAPRSRRGPVAAAVVGVPLLLSAAVPVGVAVALPFVAGALFLVAARVREWPDAVVLWRDRAGRRGAFELLDWVTGQLVGTWWAIGLVLLAATGASAFGAPRSGVTPITDGLGFLAAWLAGPAMLLASAAVLAKLGVARRFDPAIPCPTTVHVTPAFDAGGDERLRVERLLRVRGFRVRWAPATAAPTDVPVRLLEEVPPTHERTWPRDVSARALEVPELLDVLARRDAMQRRRVLLAGLERMVQGARRREYARGTGFWVAPHLWYVFGICRDAAEETREEGTGSVDGVIGLPYHVELPRAARSHAHRVLRAVEVDLVFVGDGVSWEAVRSTWRALFAHHDAGRGRIETTDLPHVPGVRALLDEHRIGDAWTHRRYPEPDFDEIGQARVLLLFVDRGGDPEGAPSPTVDEDLLVGS